MKDKKEKSENQLHLRRILPFLEKDYRVVKKEELKSKEVFKELFGDIDFDSNMLNQLYTYQNEI